MATAEKSNENYRIHLELSSEEAETLMALLGKIGGSSASSKRKYLDSIYNALDTARVGTGFLDTEWKEGCLSIKNNS